jgi:8-oxo-dGTP pyrophosphatase MutT (NUDIX family)
MSGTGKSIALAQLAARGFDVVDTDEPGWKERRDGEWIRREDRIADLLATVDEQPLFVSGASRTRVRSTTGSTPSSPSSARSVLQRDRATVAEPLARTHHELVAQSHKVTMRGYFEAMGARDAAVVIVVWRRSPELEVLVLHRSLFAESFEGDWAWTTPGGGRERGEPAAEAAARELREETGLSLECVEVVSKIAAGRPGLDIAVFAAEAAAEDRVVLSDEHDRYEWIRVVQLSRCRPGWVPALYREVLEDVGAGGA